MIWLRGMIAWAGAAACLALAAPSYAAPGPVVDAPAGAAYGAVDASQGSTTLVQRSGRHAVWPRLHPTLIRSGQYLRR
jgi:hypothetical protein